VISSPVITESSEYLYAVGNTGIYYGDDMPGPVTFSVGGNAVDTGAGLYRATFSTALGDTPPADLTPANWQGSYTAASNNTDQGSIVVSVYDRVNNLVTRSFAYTRDVQGPGTIFNFAQVPDADSGNDGFAPDLEWEDDLTINVTWNPTNDLGGSGVAGYLLGASSIPPVSAFYTSPPGSLTMAQDGYYPVYIRGKDNVGNLGSQQPIAGTGLIKVDQDSPVNGRLDIYEVSGGNYLYIADDTDITTGTLFYNHVMTSSFTVIADDTSPSFSWGAGSQSWKVGFSPGWGETTKSEAFQSPLGHTYTITPFEVTDAFTVCFVNRAGNTLAIPLEAELDTSGPAITFTDFTPPNWDNSGVLWYRTGALSGGWSFVTDVTGEQAGVAPTVGWAYWDHALGTAHDQERAAPGGDGIFTGLSGNPDGLVTVTVVLTDRVNNPNSVSMALNLDGSSPVMTPTGWSEGSEFLHLIGEDLYFSHMMPGGASATLRGSAADIPGGSGLHRASFSEEPNLAGSPDDDFSPGDWQGSYTFLAISTQGDGTAVVTVYDHVGNTITHSFTYVEDATPPVVTYTGVTDPGYDPDGDPFDYTGNWYAAPNFNDGPGNDDWAFYFDFGDSQTGIRGDDALAVWDHSNDADDQVYGPRLDLGLGTGDGIFGTGGGTSGKSVRDDADGAVTVTVRLEDNVGNIGFDSLRLGIDNTPPNILSGGWSESSPFLHANGPTLYFSHQMPGPQPATLSGQASDGTGSGLKDMSFSNEANLGLGNSPGPDTTPAAWAGVYTFTASSSAGDGTVVATLSDNLILSDNLKHQTTRTYTYVLDTTPPTTPTNFLITTPPVSPGYYNTRPLGLTWSASSDNPGGSGLLGYYLGASYPPSSFYSPTVTAADYDPGSDGVLHLYLVAKDRVSNSSLASTGPITVDTQAPVSHVQAFPEEPERRFLVQWGATDTTTWPVSYDVQYSVNDGAWTGWLTATTALTSYFGPNEPVLVDIGALYQFRVRARDYVNNVGAWGPPWRGGVRQRYVYLPIVLRNFDLSIPFAVFDGFETGAFVGWKAGGVLPQSVVPQPSPPAPNGGVYAALLGSPGYGDGCGNDNIPVGQAFIKAYANVPASGTPYLRFDYRVLSYDTVRSQSGEWWDRLEVQVGDLPLERYGDPTPSKPVNLCIPYDSGWQQAEFDLSDYAGKQVVLTFFNENHVDGWFNTYSYLDNIRIEVVP